ncbi:hypothetical protein FKN01_07985 [Streptomyces sp. 130]|nr:hypothetical protein [Streptomyces sp. 130]TRV80131.1 hypothetical protein FKN01_07985 [Streptomyces sp. 130]
MSHELVDGRFRIVRVIGRGNMGEVHQAEDLRAPEGAPERKVAVKTILRRHTGGRIDFQSESGGLKNNEINKFGEYRTKRLVLTEYARMATAGLDLEKPLVDGETYTSSLTPPPGRGPRHEGAGR